MESEAPADGLVGEGSGAPAGGMTLNEDGLPTVPGGIPEEQKNETIPPEIMEDMKNIWSVFDMQDQDKIPIGELRTIMRALDFDLNPQELKIVEKQIDPEGEGFIKFANL